MIFNKRIFTEIYNKRIQNTILYGSNTTFIYELIYEIIDRNKFKTNEYDKLKYLNYESIFIIDCHNIKNKKNIIILLDDISISNNYYSDNFKKLIIILNTHLLRYGLLQYIKRILDKCIKTSAFLLHTKKLQHFDNNILSRCVQFSLPIKLTKDITNDIIYKKTIKLLKKPLSKQSIVSIRDISYYYYMNHVDSVLLQWLFIKNIGSNLNIPNEIKYNFIHNLVELNKLYQHSYRKPIFLETMIICLFKHLENYTTNL